MRSRADAAARERQKPNSRRRAGVRVALIALLRCAAVMEASGWRAYIQDKLFGKAADNAYAPALSGALATRYLRSGYNIGAGEIEAWSLVKPACEAACPARSVGPRVVTAASRHVGRSLRSTRVSEAK